MVESYDDIVIGFNGDPYRGILRSGGGHFGYKSAKCWTLENVSFCSVAILAQVCKSIFC